MAIVERTFRAAQCREIQVADGHLSADPIGILQPALTALEVAIIQRLVDEGRLPPESGIRRARGQPKVATLFLGLLIWGFALYGLGSVLVAL